MEYKRGFAIMVGCMGERNAQPANVLVSFMLLLLHATFLLYGRLTGWQDFIHSFTQSSCIVRYFGKTS